jgi:hypothetical protein
VRKTPRNEGLDKLLRKLGDGAVKVGVLTGTGPHPKAGGALTSEVAWWNEYGTERIPERPFMRNTVLLQGRDWIVLVRALLNQFVNGKITENRALGLLGEKAKSDVQDTIVSLSTPANAPSTVARKGSANPLIDIGHLRQSIQWQIVRPGDE